MNSSVSSSYTIVPEETGSLRWFHWLIVGLSLGLTFVAWHYSRTQLREKIRLKFDRESEQAIDLVIERMKSYEDALWAGVAHLKTIDGPIDSQSWTRYASSLKIEEKYPGINGIGVIFRIEDAEKQSFVAELQAEVPEFAIHPTRQAEAYWPIAFIVPLEENRPALGLDIGFESNRVTAAQRARETGASQVTGPITLVQDSQKTPGFLFYAPFYNYNPRTGSGSESNRDTSEDVFSGLVYAPFVFNKLMKGTLAEQNRHIGLRIQDQAELLFDEHRGDIADFDPNPLHSVRIDVPIYGRTWTFDVRSAKSFRDSLHTSQPLTILIAGLIIDGLLIGLIVMLTRQSRKARRFVGKVAADLEKLGSAARVNEIGVFEFDPIKDEMVWDDAMFKLYGRQPTGGRYGYSAWSQCLHPDDRGLSEQALLDALDGKQDYDCEFRVIHPDGDIRHISARAKVYRDSSGRALRLLGATTDITDRHRTASELDSTRRLQTAILDSAGVSIVATDDHGTIVTFNRTAELMLGYSADEVIGKKTPMIFHDHDEVVARAKELSIERGREIQPGFEVFVMKATEGILEHIEWTYIRKDGSTFPALLTITALRDGDQNLTGFLGIAADVSENRRALQALAETNRNLERSNHDLAQFASVASHDLQEPLRKVNAFCELLVHDCGDELSDVGKQYIEYIVNGGERMRALIKDLLAYSRIESEGGLTEDVETNQTIRYAIDNLSELIVESKGVVTYEDLPSVRADPSRWLALFQNLISNAIKYHGDQAPRVHIQCSESDRWHEFSVSDNGIGIEPNYREQVFGVFKRLHSRAEYSGTGIGLAICKRIVEQMGGTIWVDESPEGGAKFSFRVPIDSYAIPISVRRAAQSDSVA